MVAVLAQLRDGFEWFHELRRNRAVLLASLKMLDDYPENAILKSTIASRLEDLVSYLIESRSLMKSVDYPFEHADGRITDAQNLLEFKTTIDDTVGAVEASSTFADNFAALYFRTLSRLAYIARQVESAVGLRPYSMLA